MRPLLKKENTVSLADQIVEKIERANELYHRLVMLVAPAGAGKTAALQDVHERTAARWSTSISSCLGACSTSPSASGRCSCPSPRGDRECDQDDVILLDNVEVLFDVSLKQDPLRLLQGLSRNKTVVAAWSGSIDGETHGLCDAGPS